MFKLALYKDSAVVRYDGVSLGEWFPKFRRNLMPSFSRVQEFLVEDF
jgi:hypothetical protein